MTEKRKITHAEAGRLGGLRNAQNHKDNPDFYKQLGAKGGNACLEKHGKEYYSKIGEKAGSKRWTPK